MENTRRIFIFGSPQAYSCYSPKSKREQGLPRSLHIYVGIHRTGYPGVAGGAGKLAESAESEVVVGRGGGGEGGGMNTDSARIRPFFRALSGRSQCS